MTEIRATGTSSEVEAKLKNTISLARNWEVAALAGLGFLVATLAASCFFGLSVSALIFGAKRVHLDTFILRSTSGASLAIPFAGCSLAWMWGFTPMARLGTAWFLFLGSTAFLGALLPEQAMLPLAIGGAGFSLLVILREQALRFELRAEGVVKVWGFPIWRENLILWDDLDFVQFSLLHLYIETNVGHEEETQGVLKVAGKGKTFLLRTLRFEQAEDFIPTLLETARPYVIQNTLDQLHSSGRVELGPLTLREDGVLRKGRKGLLAYRDLKWTGFEDGCLIFLSGENLECYKADGIPNAFWIPEIIEKTCERQGR